MHAYAEYARNDACIPEQEATATKAAMIENIWEALILRPGKLISKDFQHSESREQ